MDMRITEVTDFKSEVRCDIRGCLEAVMASETVKKGPNLISNMHKAMLVIEVTDFKYDL